MKIARAARLSTLPAVVTLVVLSTLAVLYLGGSLKPTTSVRHLPIAVVNEDPDPDTAKFVNTLSALLDHNEFDVRVLSPDQAGHQLDTARIYGAVKIPPDFSSKFQSVTHITPDARQASRPVITIVTNPRAGSLGASIAGQTLKLAVSAMNRKLGQGLSVQIAKQNGGSLAPAIALSLAEPIDIKTSVHDPLPEGTGNGLSAFYYSLLLLIAGVVGAVVVNTLVESMLGYIPAGFGAVYRFAQQAKTSRFAALLIEWAVVIWLALLTSAVYIAIASAFGMPIQHRWALLLYGAFAIGAVGVISTALIAALGSMGVLVSVLLFVIIGLPSVGDTLPLEAQPSFFGWLAEVEPMHQVYIGTRALLYLDGRADAGLTQAVVLTAVGMVIGLGLGAIVARFYDRRGYRDIQLAPETADADEAPETAHADTTPQMAKADT